MASTAALCPKCERPVSFLVQDVLRVRVAGHHSRVAAAYKCPYCGTILGIETASEGIAKLVQGKEIG